MVLFQLNQVVGNLISSVVLYKTPNKLTLNQTILNGTYSKILNSTIDQCGPNDLPTRQDEFIKPDQWTVYLLCSIYNCTLAKQATTKIHNFQQIMLGFSYYKIYFSILIFFFIKIVVTIIKENYF